MKIYEEIRVSTGTSCNGALALQIPAYQISEISEAHKSIFHIKKVDEFKK